MRVGERVEAVDGFVERMKNVRGQVVRLLMWEIAKTRGDAEKEFDRTVRCVEDTIEAVKDLDRAAGRFSGSAGILARLRRAPLGVTRCMVPFNYPLNEPFATLIPAVIMGRQEERADAVLPRMLQREL